MPHPFKLGHLIAIFQANICEIGPISTTCKVFEPTICLPSLPVPPFGIAISPLANVCYVALGSHIQCFCLDTWRCVGKWLAKVDKLLVLTFQEPFLYFRGNRGNQFFRVPADYTGKLAMDGMETIDTNFDYLLSGVFDLNERLLLVDKANAEVLVSSLLFLSLVLLLNTIS